MLKRTNDESSKQLSAKFVYTVNGTGGMLGALTTGVMGPITATGPQVCFAVQSALEQIWIALRATPPLSYLNNPLHGHKLA